ncbi:MAG: hypothetical protein ACON4U_10425 [Myxococcota bacterium]
MILESAQKKFGAWLQTQRELRGVSRSNLAKALGYQNLNKGCRRILAWEQGQKDIDEHFIKPLQNCIGISQQNWGRQRALLDVAKLTAQHYVQAHLNINNQTTKQLVTHFDLLMDNADKIRTSPQWHHIQLHGLKFGMMYFGGVSVQLGALVGAWSAGQLQAETEDGCVWIYSGGCSPLSGWNSLHGFNARTQQRGQYSNIFTSASSPIGFVMKRCRQSKGYSNLSLTQLLAILGQNIPPAVLLLNGKMWAEYDYTKRTLQIGQRMTKFDFDDLQGDLLSSPPVGIETVWGPKSHRGRPVVGNLLSGQMGAYIGEEWTVNSSKGVWRLRPGHLITPEGLPMVSWDSDIPPEVQVWLVRYFTEMKTVA